MRSELSFGQRNQTPEEMVPNREEIETQELMPARGRLPFDQSFYLFFNPSKKGKIFQRLSVFCVSLVAQYCSRNA